MVSRRRTVVLDNAFGIYYAWWVRATIQGVELPFDLENFITPDWDAVLKHYTRYARAVQALGEEPQAIQPYMLEFAKAIEKSGYNETRQDDTRTADDLIRRYFQHYGLSHFQVMVEAAISGIDLAAQSEALRAQIMSVVSDQTMAANVADKAVSQQAFRQQMDLRREQMAQKPAKAKPRKKPTSKPKPKAKAKAKAKAASKPKKKKTK